MKLTKLKYSILFLLFVLFTPLEAKYCIQVLSTPEREMDFIIKEAKSVNCMPFPKVRVERRSHYLTLRIGDYLQYRNAQKDFLSIKRMHPGAYLRKCEIQPKKIVYMKKDSYNYANVLPKEDIPVSNNKQKYKIQKTNEPITIIPDPIPLPEKKIVKTKRHLYEKPEELHYSESVSSQKSLWDECKRCFAPVYEEESTDTQQYQMQTKPSYTAPAHKSEEIEVNVQSTDNPSDDEFWSQDRHKSKKIKRKKKSVYNLDEQYLP